MFFCKGKKTPSKPVAPRGAAKPGMAQDAAAGTLLADPQGTAAQKSMLPVKEAFPDSIVGTEAPAATALVVQKPEASEDNVELSTGNEASERQCISQQVEASTDTLVRAPPNSFASFTSTNSQRSCLLRKQRTVAVDKDELDMMVVEYSCHDASIMTALGQHSKEARWKVQVGYDALPLDIKLHVDKGIASGPSVKVSSDNEVVFQTAGGYTTKSMYEDFEHRWPFRGRMKGLNEANMFELRPHAMAADSWFPATITGQREDGLFEVVAMMSDIIDAGGFKQEYYPAVEKADLRVARTREPLQIPERSLSLRVPRDNPFQACLSLDGQDLVTHHFARPSPCLKSTSDSQAHKNKLELSVARDRSTVTGNVGHAVLSHFVSGEVQAVSSDIQKLRHSWMIQVGPFAEHTIVVEKKHSMSRIISLTVDGQPFVEASAEDIDCYSGGWECKFRFVGESIVDFEVHESNRDGTALDSKDHVLQKKKYVHECCVTVGEHLDMRTATLTVDSQDFRDLPVRHQSHEEESISISPEALNLTYGITVPYKVNHTAPCGILHDIAEAPKTMRRVRNICC